MLRLRKNFVKQKLLFGSGDSSQNRKNNERAVRKGRKNYDRTTLTLVVMLTVFLVSTEYFGISACLAVEELSCRRGITVSYR